mmetsp:Transcript_34951/g.78575  ORF Transcript_34951/g.78575 Transcript_34951/m.78575 type:complete len:387 (-) Transcript_34951:4-1164(-)
MRPTAAVESLPEESRRNGFKSDRKNERQYRSIATATAQRQEEGSGSDPELANTEKAELLAGVARIVYLHITHSRSSRLAPSWRRCSSRRWTEVDFDHSYFFRPSGRRCCCFPWGSSAPQVTSDAAFEFLRNIIVAAAFPKELVPLAGIYIDRLVYAADVQLTASNWKCICAVAILLATKVWEDIHPWNADYADILRRAVDLHVQNQGSLYRLESQFLDALRWKVLIPADVYAAYYFSLKEGSAAQEAHLGADVGSPGRFQRGESLQSEQTTPPRCQSCGSLSSLASDTSTALPSIPTPGLSLSTSEGDLVQQSFQSVLLHPRNPYVGTFRHAKTLDPSSLCNGRRCWSDDNVMRSQAHRYAARHPLLHSHGNHSRSDGSLLIEATS